MKNEMTLTGIGPKLGMLCLPYVLLALFVMFKYSEYLNLTFLDNPVFKVIGFVWLAIGIIFWIYSAIYFLRHFKPGNLLTTGPFALCRNPIYSSIILFIIPAIGILLHSGLILSIALVVYINFRISIHGEAVVLKRLFGEQYVEYCRKVNEIVPFGRVN